MERIMHMKIECKNAGTLYSSAFTTEEIRRLTSQERSQETITRWNEWLFFQMKLRMECGTTAVIGRTLQTSLDDQGLKCCTGKEIVKPLRKTMKKLAQVAHHEKILGEVNC
jgi:hypothetical protein